jgi:hypothetical protein
MTAYNQWLSTTRSIPCWTTSVFSSTVTKEERRITAHTLNCLERRLSDEFSRSCLHGSLYRLARIHGNPCKWFVITKTCLLKRSLVSNRGSIVDCFNSRMCLPKRCMANGDIPYIVVSLNLVCYYIHICSYNFRTFCVAKVMYVWGNSFLNLCRWNFERASC